MGDDGDGVAKGPGDGDESIKRQETNMLQTAAEEEVGNAPEGVEDGFVLGVEKSFDNHEHVVRIVFGVVRDEDVETSLHRSKMCIHARAHTNANMNGLIYGTRRTQASKHACVHE